MNARSIADTLAGIRRETRVRPNAKKAAIAAADLMKMIAAVRGIGSKAVRDRAILALGLASALRRSELVALQLADVQLVKQGARITIRSSKTDQEGEGVAKRSDTPNALQNCKPPFAQVFRSGCWCTGI